MNSFHEKRFDQHNETETLPVLLAEERPDSNTPQTLSEREAQDATLIESIRSSLTATPAVQSANKEVAIVATPVQQSPSRLPHWLRKAALFAGMLGIGLSAHTAASAHESSDDITKAKKENRVESKEDVTDTLRRDWNDYVDWLEMKGLKGDATLDRNGLGVEMIAQYRTEHPETTVSNETINLIQEEFSNYRAWALDQIKQGKAAFAPGVTAETFMINLSENDNYAGQLTTMKKFPLAYLQSMKDHSLQSKKTVGFAKAQKNFQK